ncbi:MAG TPA: zf-HC2 domain-containing protein [Candidatus Polarisedimenticolaceae bacterium]|nr:zf-HC2 domain-containing protein [Candidatus Polarisedimenticolaceae bacterium]
MECASFHDHLIGRLYGELAAEDDAALDGHLAGCASCRTTLEEFARVRSILAEDEPAVPRIPRVLVLRPRARWRTAALAASIAGAALLTGTGIGAGYAIGSRRNAPAPVAMTTPAALDDATQQFVRDEVARRLAAASAAKPVEKPAGLSAADVQSQLAKFERKVNDARAADLDYMLGQLEASELRTGSRIGKTNEAIKNVALASNPYMGSQ